MKLFTNIFCASSLVIFCFNLNAMDVTRQAVCASLNLLQDKITKEDSFKGQLFAFSIVKKANNPKHSLDGYYAQRLTDANLLNSDGSMQKDVADAIKIWAANRTTSVTSFEFVLTQQRPYETYNNQQ